MKIFPQWLAESILSVSNNSSIVFNRKNDHVWAWNEGCVGFFKSGSVFVEPPNIRSESGKFAMPSTIMGENKNLLIRSQQETDSLFEPVPDNSYDLSYACLLIPRFQNHYLTGDLAEYVYTWMQQICISFGWRLEYIDIQPEYMQWLLNVPFSVSPAQIIRIVRQQTSKKIFDDFPKFKNQNTGKDFWAPGHLVIVGKQLHLPQMIHEFIHLTRQQQAAGSFGRG